MQKAMERRRSTGEAESVMRCVHGMLPRDWADIRTINNTWRVSERKKEYEHNEMVWYTQGLNAKFNGILHFTRRAKANDSERSATVANILPKAVMPFSRQQSESNQMK